VRWALLCAVVTLATLSLAAWPAPGASVASGSFNILDYAPPGTVVDQQGQADASPALAGAIRAANLRTARGLPGCVHIPAGIYRIASAPPPFARAGCVKGDGSSQSILRLDKRFAGDLFSWSEAWYPTTPGPTVVGLRIDGSPTAPARQNALMFYDRNDEVFIDDVTVNDLPGRALYSGVTRHSSQAYMRESHMRSLRFFRDGAPGTPVVEFTSAGKAPTGATNEIRVSQMDIYGSRGPSLVIRNQGDGAVRDLTFDALRIEGTENGDTAADLLTIGDPVMRGVVGDITFTGLELIDPYRGFAAFRMTAPRGAIVPGTVTASGFIGGGLPHGEGLRIDAGRTSTFRFSVVNTEGTNIVIGPGVSEIVLDGGGQERRWTKSIDPTSRRGVLAPARRNVPLDEEGAEGPPSTGLP